MKRAPVPLLRFPRPKRRTHAPTPPGGELVARFFELAEEQGVAMADLAARAGYSHTVAAKWHSRHVPGLRVFLDHLQVLGRTLAIIPIGGDVVSKPTYAHFSVQGTRPCIECAYFRSFEPRNAKGSLMASPQFWCEKCADQIGAEPSRNGGKPEALGKIDPRRPGCKYFESRP